MLQFNTLSLFSEELFLSKNEHCIEFWPFFFVLEIAQIDNTILIPSHFFSFCEKKKNQSMYF